MGVLNAYPQDQGADAGLSVAAQPAPNQFSHSEYLAMGASSIALLAVICFVLYSIRMQKRQNSPAIPPRSKPPLTPKQIGLRRLAAVALLFWLVYCSYRVATAFDYYGHENRDHVLYMGVAVPVIVAAAIYLCRWVWRGFIPADQP